MKHIVIEDSKGKDKRFVQLILTWAEKNKRSFPWRKDRTPYKVLLAEILLQRTPANRVADFFPRFMERFPSPESLASTEVDRLKEFLHPMGLKKRAVWLIVLMQEICAKYNCKVPATEEDLVKLSGIGPYTARAILVFASKKDLAIVDVNIARVLERVFKGSTQLKRPSENEELWSFAAKLVPRRHGPQYNEALLDFAALICKRNPLCYECPLRSLCEYAMLDINAQKKPF